VFVSSLPCESALVTPAMVEIRLDAVEQANLPQDIFLSVRVGEAQKLSKLSSSRIYKFPSVDGRRFGKIEVFRRLATYNIDVDAIHNHQHNVDIGCGADPLGVLRLAVAVEEQRGTEKKVQEPKKDSGKLQAAKDYLQKHGLEKQLSDAMLAVLRERPNAPAEFLAKHLLAATGKAATNAPLNQPKSGGEVVKVVAPPSCISPIKAYYGTSFRSLDPNLLAKCHTKFPRKQVKVVVPPPPVLPVKAKAGGEVVKEVVLPPPILPFKAYYTASFLSLDLNVSAQCYARFPRKPAKPITAVPKYAVKAEAESGVIPMRLMPSCGTWIGKLPKALNIRMQTPLLPTHCNTRFPCEPAKPTTAALEYTVNTEAKLGVIPSRLMPSCGTWIGQLPKALKIQTQKPLRPSMQDTPVQLLPSVGTWRNRIPRRMRQLPALETPALRIQTQKPLRPSIQDMPVQLLPSVVTWRNRIPRRMRQLPALGTPAQ